MPRFYPANDCDFYVERVVDKYHNVQPPEPKNHILRKNQLRNPVKWFRDQDHSEPNRSFISSWGIEENYKKNTELTCNRYYRTRLRCNAAVPTAGQSAIWRTTRIAPCGFGKLPLHEWKIDEWLQRSSFRKSKTDEI